MNFFKENHKRFLAETIGAFVLVFISLGVHAVFEIENEIISLIAYSVTVILLAYTIVGISGCHVNPAVTVGAAVNKEITWKQAAGYVVSQFIGGAAAGLVLFGLLETGGEGLEILHIEIGAGVSEIYSLTELELVPYTLILQFFTVFMFVLLVLGAESKFHHGKLHGFINGLTLIFEHLIAVQFAFAVVNPAIALGRMIITETGDDLLIRLVAYILVPAAAALAAGFTAKATFLGSKDQKHGYAEHSDEHGGSVGSTH